MKFRKAEAPYLTTEKARHGTSTANFEANLRLPPRSGRRRPDPFAGIWDSEIAPMLGPHPGCVPLSCCGRFVTAIPRSVCGSAVPWSDAFDAGRH